MIPSQKGNSKHTMKNISEVEDELEKALAKSKASNKALEKFDADMTAKREPLALEAKGNSHAVQVLMNQYQGLTAADAPTRAGRRGARAGEKKGPYNISKESKIAATEKR